jgi:hypothetical protein
VGHLDESGEASVKTTVRRVFEANDFHGDPISEVDCATVEHGCFLRVGGTHATSDAAISFAQND